MKSIKILFLFLALLNFVNSFSQTNEEKINWIKNNGKTKYNLTYLDKKGLFKSKEMRISIYEGRSIYNLGYDLYVNFIIEGIKAEYNIELSEKILMEDILYEDIDKIDINYSDSNKLKPNTYFEIFYKKPYHGIESIPFYFFPKDEKIVRETLKAIMYIAKLDGAIEKK